MGARVCTSTRRESTSLYEYHPNRQRDLEGTSTRRESTSRYKGCTSLYEYHPSQPSQKPKGRHE